MLPEDGNPQFTLEEAPSGVSTDPNDRPLQPLNEYLSSDESRTQSIHYLEASYLKRLAQLT